MVDRAQRETDEVRPPFPPPLPMQWRKADKLTALPQKWKATDPFDRKGDRRAVTPFRRADE